MKVHDWTAFAALGAVLAGLLALACGAPRLALECFVVASSPPSPRATGAGHAESGTSQELA